VSRHAAVAPTDLAVTLEEGAARRPVEATIQAETRFPVSPRSLRGRVLTGTKARKSSPARTPVLEQEAPHDAGDDRPAPGRFTRSAELALELAHRGEVDRHPLDAAMRPDRAVERASRSACAPRRGESRHRLPEP
jgi:hypothetical protein